MNPSLEEFLIASIRTIPDYPKPGILFRDITTLLGNARAFRRAVDELVHPYAGQKIDKIAGIEARGFILGGAIAHQISAGFIPIRKKGKLPHETVRVAYSLEYGLDEMEMHKDAVDAGEKVILVDDLIATGGTAEGAVKLLRQMGADIVAACFVIDLPDLGGRAEARGARRDRAYADRLRRALRAGRAKDGRTLSEAISCERSRIRCDRPSSTFTSTALSNSITLSPVESKPSARIDSTRQPGREASARWSSQVRV